jgi:hypothetical protein
MLFAIVQTEENTEYGMRNTEYGIFSGLVLVLELRLLHLNWLPSEENN